MICFSSALALLASSKRKASATSAEIVIVLLPERLIELPELFELPAAQALAEEVDPEVLNEVAWER
jgi:ABC-type transporter Mla MlaB component